jgi:hypothetical protein
MKRRMLQVLLVVACAGSAPAAYAAGQGHASPSPGAPNTHDHAAAGDAARTEAPRRGGMMAQRAARTKEIDSVLAEVRTRQGEARVDAMAKLMVLLVEERTDMMAMCGMMQATAKTP